MSEAVEKNEILDLTKKIELLVQRIERLEFLCDAKTVTILEFSKGFFSRTVKIHCQKEDWDVIYHLSKYLTDDIYDFHDSFHDSLIPELVKNTGCIEKDKGDFIEIIDELTQESRRHYRCIFTEKDNAIFMKDVMICQAIER